MRARYLVSFIALVAVAALAPAETVDVASQGVGTRRAPNAHARRITPDRPSVALQALSTCEDLRSYLIDVAVERALEYRYGWWTFFPWADGAGGGREAASDPLDYTTTNNQEDGVDEIDIVKTNGTHLFAAEGSLHVLSSWPPEATSQIATITSPGSSSQGLFLRDDKVVDASYVWDSELGTASPVGATRFTVLDVANPGSPTVQRTIEIEGYLIDARLIEGDLYAVIHSAKGFPDELWDLAFRDDIGLPDMPRDISEEERERILDQARTILRPYVEDLFAAIPIEEFLPALLDRRPGGVDGSPQPLLECGSIYRPAQALTTEWEVLSVVHIDVDERGPVSAVGLASSGWTVYSSVGSLYVTQTSDRWGWGWGWAPERTPVMTTAIHKFVLDPTLPLPVRYAASGEVDGWILDQFALSEHAGYLRVATTDFDWWWGTTADDEPSSSVTVLADNDRGSLVEVGRIDGLGPGEQIYAVRFMGTKGYVVTFEQVDPLFILDLSDPTAPAILGELEVTGFSSYLHPIGDDWLLAIGQEANDDGRIIGLAISIFDVRDPGAPALAHRHLVESGDTTWSWSEALNDHHAFTYHRGILSIPAYINGPQGRFSGLLVLAADPVDGIRELGRIDHQELGGPGHQVWIRRSVYIEDALYSLSTVGIKVNSLFNPDVELASVAFED